MNLRKFSAGVLYVSWQEYVPEKRCELISQFNSVNSVNGE